MSESLLTSSKATAELLNTTREFTIAQEESRKKSTVFGKVLQGAFVNINFVWKLFTTAFNGFDGILERIGIRFQMFAVDAVKDLRFLLNLYIRATNLMNKGTGIEPIELISAEGQDAKIAELQNRLEKLTVERTKLATASTLAIFGKQAVSSAELASFTTVLQSGGAAAKELQEFLGTDNINKFAQQISEANSTNSLAGFSPAIQKLVENLGLMNDGTISSAEVITLLSSSFGINQNTSFLLLFLDGVRFGNEVVSL